MRRRTNIPTIASISSNIKDDENKRKERIRNILSDIIAEYVIDKAKGKM